MKSDKLNYSSVGESREELSPIVLLPTEEGKAVVEPIGEISAGYSKREPVVDVKILFIISGGEKREKDYFRVLMKNCGSILLKVAFCSKKGNGLNPQGMVEKAKKFLDKKLFITAKDAKAIPMEGDDTIYLLQDIDLFEADIRELNKKGMPVGAEWVISNPAFEIWLFYHYFDSPKGRIDELDSLSVGQRSQRLKQLLDEVKPGGINPMQAFYEMKTAIENSKINWRENKGLPALYSTQMHVLASEILRLLGEDNFDKLKARWAENIRFWKEHSLRKSE